MPKVDPLFATILAVPETAMQMVSREVGRASESDVLPAVLRSVSDLCAKLDPAAIERNGRFDATLVAHLGVRGLFGLTVPESFGGAGFSLKSAARVVTELATHDGSLAACVGLHSGLALHALLNEGAHLHERYLGEVATGHRIAAFAATEPAAGSDISGVRTTLTEVRGRLLLTGSKCFVTNGGLCGLITVLARSPDLFGTHAGHTLVLVDPTWRGVSRGVEEKKLGLRASSTITIDFDGVDIPRDHLLGTPAHGLDAAHRALAWGRSMLAAGCLGTARGALAHARAHTEQRVQFGRALIRFPLVRDTLAGAVADLYAVESVVRLSCERVGDNRGNGQESAIAKVFASETAWSIVDASLQLLGGSGYIEDIGMARRLRDVRVTRIFEGSNEVLRLHLASAVLGWSLDGEPPTLGRLVSPPHAEAARHFDRDLAAMLCAFSSIRAQHGFKLFDRQTLQVAMADAIICTYARLAVLLRMSSARSEQELAVAELSAIRLAARTAALLAKMAEAADPAMPRRIDTILSQ